MNQRPDHKVLEKLLEKIERIPFSGCHIWMASCMKNGYGQIGYKGTNAYAHRVSWLLQKGPIPDGMNVLHRCDTRCCINPDHLFLGSQMDNIHDMMRKGRENMKSSRRGNPLRKNLRKGESHGMAKITAENVKEIRLRYAAGEQQKALGAEFGIKQAQVSRIVLNQSWN